MLQKQKEKGIIKEIEGSRWVTFRERNVDENKEDKKLISVKFAPNLECL